MRGRIVGLCRGMIRRKCGERYVQSSMVVSLANDPGCRSNGRGVEWEQVYHIRGSDRQQACNRTALNRCVYVAASPSLATNGFPRSKKGPLKSVGEISDQEQMKNAFQTSRRLGSCIVFTQKCCLERSRAIEENSYIMMW